MDYGFYFIGYCTYDMIFLGSVSRRCLPTATLAASAALHLHPFQKGLNSSYGAHAGIVKRSCRNI